MHVVDCMCMCNGFNFKLDIINYNKSLYYYLCTHCIIIHTHTHNMSGAIAYSNSYFGHHSLPSNIYFNCFGNESSLSSCQSSTTTCNFANTAGVYCKGDVISGKLLTKIQLSYLKIN